MSSEVREDIMQRIWDIDRSIDYLEVFRSETSKRLQKCDTKRRKVVEALQYDLTNAMKSIQEYKLLRTEYQIAFAREMKK